MGAEISQSRGGLPAQFFELAQSAGQHNFTDRGRDAFADSGKPGYVGIFADHLIETFRKGTDARGGPPVGFHLVGLFLLRRKQLRQAGESIRDFGVAQAFRLLEPFRFTVNAHSPAVYVSFVPWPSVWVQYSGKRSSVRGT